MEKSGVSLRHFEAMAKLVPHKQCDEMLERLAGAAGTGFLFAMDGVGGTGKTMIATRLIVRFAERGMFAIYMRASALFRAVRDSLGQHSEVETFNDFVRTGLLVIDEAHERGNSAFEDNTLSEIIDARYQRKRDTLLITNYAPGDFAKAIGISVSGRIREAGGRLHCNWESFRPQAGK